MTGPRFDLVSLSDDRQNLVISFGSEADLRDGLHALALAYGWDVTSEVSVPNWGRIDLLFELPTAAWIVELKAKITQPATLRRALTQVHGYSAAFTAKEQTQFLRAFVVAPEIPAWAYEMANVAYPSVTLLTVSDLMGWLRFEATSDPDAAADMEAGLRRCANELAVREHAVARCREDQADAAAEEEAACGVISEAEIDG